MPSLRKKLPLTLVAVVTLVTATACQDSSKPWVSVKAVTTTPAADGKTATVTVTASINDSDKLAYDDASAKRRPSYVVGISGTDVRATGTHVIDPSSERNQDLTVSLTVPLPLSADAKVCVSTRGWDKLGANPALFTKKQYPEPDTSKLSQKEAEAANVMWYWLVEQNDAKDWNWVMECRLIAEATPTTTTTTTEAPTSATTTTTEGPTTTTTTTTEAPTTTTTMPPGPVDPCLEPQPSVPC